MGDRIGGSGVSHYVVKESTGINYMLLAIQNAFGVLDSNRIPHNIVAKNVAGNYIIPVQGSGVVEEIQGIESLQKDS